MASRDFSAPRLFVEAPLVAGASVELGREQANYLVSVLRLGTGDPVLVFNGRDGEWRAEITSAGRKDAALRAVERTRPQADPSAIAYLFAPLKHARLDYVVQKAVEMGVGSLHPVLTRRTVPTRVNAARMRANVVEAAEQCGILALPRVAEPQRLDAVLSGLDPDCLLVFCDEDADVRDPMTALAGAEGSVGIAVLVGPEGGFDEDERRAVRAHPNARRISLGPRILRADTAAVAALALVQAVFGDWR